MLLNFCNPNQLLAAININGSVLTLFFRPDSGFENEAFVTYLTHGFKIDKFAGSSLLERNHEAVFHHESLHLMRLMHMHFDFGVSIDKDFGKMLLQFIKKYQGKNSDSVSIRKSYEDYQRNKAGTSMENIYKFLRYFKNFRISVKAELPILSHKNIKRLEAEFAKLPVRTFSSSPQIINFLNQTVEKHDLAVPSNLSQQRRLVANTCPEINGLVKAQDDNVNSMFAVWNAALTTASALSALYCYRRYMRYMNPPAPERVEDAAPRQVLR
jgi:hypothetical protein